MSSLGIIGWPLKHSLSPVFQQAALDYIGLDARYEAWETPPDMLPEAVERLRLPCCLGANVTIPHKEAVAPLLDGLDDVAREVRAVNTIVNDHGILRGYNTDVSGFLRALREDGGFEPKGRRVVVAGAGGAARAVVFALIQAGAADVIIINRTLSRAARLADQMRGFASETRLLGLPGARGCWSLAAPGCDLLVNCTSLGLAGTPVEKKLPLPEKLIPADTFVFDLVYRPEETALIAAARRRGARVLSGLSMLIYQGAESFSLWTGKPAPVDIMFEAARAALTLTRAKREG